MHELVLDMFYQLGIRTEVLKGNADYFEVSLPNRTYLHYDEIEPFTKLNSFKGVGIYQGNLTIQFLR